ncbi:hypothetical protein E5S70_28760 [Ensifer adhaerens]|nr:hypothetical protein [Ensifer canadensis]
MITNGDAGSRSSTGGCAEREFRHLQRKCRSPHDDTILEVDLIPRKGSPSPRLDGGEFKKRFLQQFQDSSSIG